MSDKAITAVLLKTVRELFKTDLDALSVNNVRKIAEEQLDLSPGFLKGDAWKAKSKELITGEVVSTPIRWRIARAILPKSRRLTLA